MPPESCLVDGLHRLDSLIVADEVNPERFSRRHKTDLAGMSRRPMILPSGEGGEWLHEGAKVNVAASGNIYATNALVINIDLLVELLDTASTLAECITNV